MPRKNQFGKNIFTASEVATYALCPEAWRLTYIEKVSTDALKDKAKAGEKDHDIWTKNFDDAVYLTRAKYLIWILIGLLIVFYMIEVSIR